MSVRQMFGIILASMVLGNQAVAEVPARISYQGILSDAAGAIVADGNHQLTFRLYSSAGGGTALWSETQTLAVTGGLFNAELGSVTAFTMDFNSPYWLGVSVGAEAELTPRTALTASPYSLNAHRLNGYEVKSFATSAHSHLLDGITNVDAPSPTNGEVLTYSSIAGNWVAQSPAADYWAGNSAGPIYRLSGSVGIGTSGPTSRLQVEAETSTAIKGKVTYTSTADHVAVEGFSRGADGHGIGGRFEGSNAGVSAYASRQSSGNSYAVNAEASGTAGTKFGVRGYSWGAGTNYGVWGVASGGTTNYAGYFSGNVHVNGTLSKSAGSFRIDHPLDPANMTLSHSFVESPDMKNIYDGNVVLGADGSAWVELPAWFDALNRDFRYQLTCLGEFAPVYVAAKIAGNRFRIAGGSAGMEVSWQVTGIRRDPYAEANRIQVETPKEPADRGRYFNPEAYGLPAAMGVDYEANQAQHRDGDR